ncbi:MAG: hypothetical protein IVW36_08430 [Dehalococcoidia bacterium]|nr:hypothetical protein [Dehalococcoidia bacterium]
MPFLRFERIAIRAPFRVPFTLVTLAVLAFFAVQSRSAFGELPERAIERVGFAPYDLLAFDWGRIFNSALFTRGGVEFWAAVAMVLLAVGIAEWFAGTAFAALTFWGVHLLTLVVESVLVALPLKLAGVAIGAQIVELRDVGPSAGYVGALGVVCAMLPPRWRYLAAAAVLGALLYVGFAPDVDGSSIAAIWSATIAHLIAFPLGFAAYLAWSRLRTRRGGGRAGADQLASSTPTTTRP